MAFLNDLYRYVQGEAGIHAPTFEAALDALLLLLAPPTPHIAAELWSRRHDGEDVHAKAWPTASAEMLVMETVTMIVQVNGKVRDRVEVPADADEESCVAAALGSARVQELLGGEPTKVIARPPKLVNFVL